MEPNYDEECISHQDVEIEYTIKIFGIEFAPFIIPFSRRVETWAVSVLFIYMFFGIKFNMTIIMMILSNFLIAWMPILYMFWMCYDMNTALTGGRKVFFVRKLQIWKHIRDYFPINLVKTADLPPRSNYIFSVHPRGICSLGTLINFGTDANGFEKMFAGLQPHLLFSSFAFYIPFTRETILSLGSCSIAEQSVLNLLSDPNGGKVAVANSGGTQELFKAKPGTYHFFTNYSLAEQAVKSGAPLVPVISFGENDIYNELQHKYLNKIAEFIYKYIGYRPIFLMGRGFYQYTFGLLPHRKPINTVVGKAIPIQKNENPSEEEVNNYYKQYKSELEALFNEHKKTYVENVDQVEFKIE